MSYLTHPDNWGHLTWVLIHGISKRYHKDFATFLTLLTRVIPCINCRESFPVILNNLFDTDSKILQHYHPFFAQKLHEAVTEKLIYQGKKQTTYRYSYLQKYLNIPPHVVATSFQSLIAVLKKCTQIENSGVCMNDVIDFQLCVQKILQV
jgi:hypothetical protein